MYLFKYTIKSKQTRILKKLKFKKYITATKSKETRNNVLT